MELGREALAIFQGATLGWKRTVRGMVGAAVINATAPLDTLARHVSVGNALWDAWLPLDEANVSTQNVFARRVSWEKLVNQKSLCP